MAGAVLVSAPPVQTLGTQQLTGPRGFASVAWSSCCGWVRGLCSPLYTYLSFRAASRTLDPNPSSHRCLKAEQEQPSPKPPSHAGLVRPVPASILAAARASSLCFPVQSKFPPVFSSIKRPYKHTQRWWCTAQLTWQCCGIPGCVPPPLEALTPTTLCKALIQTAII